MGQKELSIHFQEMGELTDELQEIAEEIKNSRIFLSAAR